jgi:NTP pyrophosphatase (non-canonical NTP hydrolase)
METVESITVWQEETFGPKRPGIKGDRDILARAAKEAAELAAAIASGATEDKILEELADVYIVLAPLALRHRETRGAAIFSTTYYATMSFAEMRGESRSEHYWTSLAEFVAESLFYRTIDPLKCQAAIDAKMAINRARKWVVTGNGHGQHVDGE